MLEHTNPNHLTLFRVAAAPLFLYCFPIQSLITKWFCLILVILAVISDYWDGQLARRQKRVSLFGKFFDPLSDFLFFVTVFLAFWQTGLVPLWMVSLVCMRELVMHTGLRPYFSVVGIDPGARWSGKLKTTFQCIFAIVVCLNESLPVGMQIPGFNWVTLILFGIVVLLSWLSIAEYFVSLQRSTTS